MVRGLLNSVLKKKLDRRIAELRRAQGLTQERLAEAIDCWVEFISLVERGFHMASAAELSERCDRAI